MPAKIIDGKKLAENITNEVKKEISALDFTPGLAVFLIGSDPASRLYVKLKEKACKKVGIDFHKYFCEDDACEADILEAIEFLNSDDEINAILVQLPLPEDFDENKIIQRLHTNKDVDGFHPETLQKYLEDKDDFIPGLSEGILRLIESTGEALPQKKALIIANSVVFSRPLEKLLKEKGVKSETASPDDRELAQKSASADILIVAVGRPNFITADMVKEGAIVIDVGTTMVKGKTIGDVNFEEVKNKAGHITPVPGGVGPVTVAMLLENVVKLAKRQKGR